MREREREREGEREREREREPVAWWLWLSPAAAAAAAFCWITPPPSAHMKLVGGMRARSTRKRWSRLAAKSWRWSERAVFVSVICVACVD
jgi:hypothetical protein